MKNKSRNRFETVIDDPLDARLYTLENGLKIYMTVYRDAPRIQTAIAVKVGSKNDPPDTTGLAHYLEHLLFKGTDKFGTLNYEKEQKKLAEIIQLFELYRHTKDFRQRKRIYRQIDKISYKASKYAIASEYNKMLSRIGAKGTNAYTGKDQTVYINDIPSNQIQNWITIESERFRNPVMRLFHTELEVVYEEKNRSLDNDNRKIHDTLYALLFPTHPYGTQTTLGKVEHLKNPSIEKVQQYYHAYYVPNNMAICLSGDFDPDSVTKLIAEKFGDFSNRQIPEANFPQENAIENVIEEEIFGPDMESISIGYRVPGVLTHQADLLWMTDYILMNRMAGLIDINLIQQQKVINPYSYASRMTDYSVHILTARPRNEQNLDEVKKLLLNQLNLIKKGDFPDWLPAAVVKDLKIHRIRNFETNLGRTLSFVEAFISNMPWYDYVKKIDQLESVLKQDLVQFANNTYDNNYVAIYKLTGEDVNLKKIKKPKITPVKLNRQAESDFAKKITKIKTQNIEPVFLNYQNDIKHLKLNNKIPVRYIQNIENDIFRIYYLIDIGTNHDKKLDVAMNYLQYLGTSKYSAIQLKQELYKIGCSLKVSHAPEQTQISLSGFTKNFDKGLELFEHLLNNPEPNQKALNNLIQDTLKKRVDNKLSKWRILHHALYHYGMFGADSPYTYILSESELNKLKAEQVVSIIKNLYNHDHRILYYGPKKEDNFITSLSKYHSMSRNLQSLPDQKYFTELTTDENKIFVVDYNMKQVEIVMISKSEQYNPNSYPIRNLFNEYYGNNMSSVVFQTLRESKALAYSVYGAYISPHKKERSHYIYSYIGTQIDKLGEALNGMLDLLNSMPESEVSFEASKEAIIKKITTERITKRDILFDYERQLRLGNKYDLRQDVYNKVPLYKLGDLKSFFNEYIKEKKYTILVLGDTQKLNLNLLARYGTLKQLTLEEIFGY